GARARAGRRRVVAAPSQDEAGPRRSRRGGESGGAPGLFGGARARYTSACRLRVSAVRDLDVPVGPGALARTLRRVLGADGAALAMPAQIDLTGRVALVTGASRGIEIGRASCRERVWGAGSAGGLDG